LIDYRLTLLSKKRLLGLCVSVGGSGCGGSKIASGGGSGGGGGSGSGGGNGGSGDAGGLAINELSANDKQLLAVNCLKALQSPTSYKRDMVAVCRVVKM
jgi:hypothetical protein